MKIKIITASAVALSILASCAGLPDRPPSENIVWLKQGWSEQDRQKFHHTSQGTMTLPLPYDWFAALEQPGFSLFGEKGLLIENGYLSKLGFISGEVTEHNQAGLPVGFSVDYNVTNPAISKTPFNAIGLTCAACHTSQMNIGDTSVRLDGGPAVSDLDSLTTVLGLSLIETYLGDSKFDRFAQRILGVTNTEVNKAKLKEELTHTLRGLAHTLIDPSVVKATGVDIDQIKEADRNKFVSTISIIKDLLDDRKNDKSTKAGFTRLDALNSIGNRVFATDTGNLKNTASKQAPVNYPHIWNTSWFLWVQYDASIMAPMIRNAGEAMGVGAYVKLDENDPDNFKSSVKVNNLYWMEELLGGEMEVADQPFEKKKFGGLQAPKWEENIFGKIDEAKHAKGAKLYADNCQGCHLPPMDSNEFWSDKYWTQPNEDKFRFLNLPIVDLNHLGTDPEQANVLINRTVDTRGVGFGTASSGESTDIYLETTDWFDGGNKPVYVGGNHDGCKTFPVQDGAAVPFSASLGAAVQRVNEHWYNANNISEEKQDEMNGHRINCLRAPYAYKARPLDGIWATAPFLHNGAVPTIYDLLSPVSERPNEFYLGSLDYDVKKMGYNSSEEKDYFKLDTSIKGNSNKGHEFSNNPGKGVIGRLLSESERYELIEYLKDIKTVNN